MHVSYLIIFYVMLLVQGFAESSTSFLIPPENSVQIVENLLAILLLLDISNNISHMKMSTRLPHSLTFD